MTNKSLREKRQDILFKLITFIHGEHSDFDGENVREALDEIERLDKEEKDNLSLCSKCSCMTKNICGKCKEEKEQ